MHFIDRAEERLAETEFRKACLLEMFEKIVHRIEGRIFIEQALVLSLLIRLADGAVPVNEADDECAPGFEHAENLPEGQIHIIEKADCGDHP